MANFASPKVDKMNSFVEKLASRLDDLEKELKGKAVQRENSAADIGTSAVLEEKNDASHPAALTLQLEATRLNLQAQLMGEELANVQKDNVKLQTQLAEARAQIQFIKSPSHLQFEKLQQRLDDMERAHEKRERDLCRLAEEAKQRHDLELTALKFDHDGRLKSKNAEIVLFRQELDILLAQMQEAAGG
jgi:hypothetical protein